MLNEEENKTNDTEQISDEQINTEALRNEIRRQIEQEEREKKKAEQQKKDLKQKITNRDVIIIGLIIIIILLLLIRGCGNAPDIAFLQPVKEKTEEISEDIKQQKSQLYVTMPIITDMVNDVVLYCPQENKDLFEIAYIFTDPESGNELYRTAYLKAGDTVSVRFADFLSKGEHKVKVSITSRYIETQKAANGAGSTVTITVK